MNMQTSSYEEILRIIEAAKTRLNLALDSIKTQEAYDYLVEYIEEQRDLAQKSATEEPLQTHDATSLQPKLTPHQRARAGLTEYRISDAQVATLDKENIQPQPEQQPTSQPAPQAKSTAPSQQPAPTPQMSPQQIASVALLGVLNAQFAGSVRPVVRQEWGNLFAVPDMNPNHGMAVIDEANKLDYSHGDSLGLEMDRIEEILRSDRFSKDFVNYLDRMNIQEQRPMETPRPQPPGTKTNPF